MTNPFAALGLPARPDLTDEQIRAAWRAIAAATHPDRPDCDPARYAAASAAYATLRTGWGRSEAYADLTAQAPPAAVPAARQHRRRLLRPVALLPARIRHGRPLRMAVRVLAAVALALTVVHASAGGPAEAGTVTGLAIWLTLTLHGDLAPPPGR